MGCRPGMIFELDMVKRQVFVDNAMGHHGKMQLNGRLYGIHTRMGHYGIYYGNCGYYRIYYAKRLAKQSLVFLH
jgi:hypothetical protein